MTPDDIRASAERIIREPYWAVWRKEAEKESLFRLEQAKTHEDLMRAQAWHQAVTDLEAAVRKAAKL